MTVEKVNARELLAKMEAEEKAAKEKADKLATENEAKRKELLDGLRKEDLEDVIAKCKLHGFTPSDLRGALKTRSGKSSTPRKSTACKTGTRGRKKAA